MGNSPRKEQSRTILLRRTMYNEISKGMLLEICPFLALSLCAVRSLAPIAASPPPELELSKLSGQIDPSRCLRTRVDGFSRGGSSVIIR